jgi:hypothetical protein
VPSDFNDIFQILIEISGTLSSDSVRQNTPRPARFTDQVTLHGQLSNGARVD